MPEAFLHKNKPLAIVVGILLTVLMHIGNFILPIPPSPNMGPLYTLMQVDAWPLTLQTTVCILLIISCGALLDVIISRFNFLGSISGYPVIFFGVFASLHPVMGTMAPGLAALLFIILGILAFMINFGQSHGQFSAWASGVCFALASLLYTPFVLFIPFAITSMVVLKPARWREYAAQVLGFGLPYGIFYSILYLADIPFPAWDKPGYADIFKFIHGFSFSWGFWLAAITCFVLLNIALLNIFRTFNTYKIITRRFFTIVILIPAFLIPASVWPQIPDTEVWWPVVIPFSVLMGRLFLDIKKPAFARLILIILILVMLLARFDYYFGSGFTFKLVN